MIQYMSDLFILINLNWYKWDWPKLLCFSQSPD
jgi:hypothetical protein